jgi:hypothetical protein
MRHIVYAGGVSQKDLLRLRDPNSEAALVIEGKVEGRTTFCDIIHYSIGESIRCGEYEYGQ